MARVAIGGTTRLRGLGFPAAWFGAFLALSWLFPSFELYGEGEKPRRRRFAWAFFTFVALPLALGLFQDVIG
jgi:hypothetical protein